MDFDGVEDQPDYAALNIELSEDISNEQKLWEMQGYNPGMIIVDQYMLNMKMRAVLSIMTEVLGMTSDQLDWHFKSAVLEQLKNDREMITRDMARQNIQKAADPFRGLLGPNGNPMSN